MCGIATVAAVVLALTPIQVPRPTPPTEAADAAQRRAEARQQFQEGVALMDRERYAEAEEKLRRTLALDPEMFLAHYALGKIYMALKQYPDAVRSYSGARDVYRQLATAVNDRRLEGAQVLEDRIREQRDWLVELRSALSLARSETEKNSLQNRISNVEAGIMNLERLRGGHVGAEEPPVDVLVSLGSAQLMAGQVEDAERTYLDAVRVDPKGAKAHNNLAVIYLKKGEFDKAAEHVELAEKAGLKVHPDLKKEIERRKVSR